MFQFDGGHSYLIDRMNRETASGQRLRFRDSIYFHFTERHTPGSWPFAHRERCVALQLEEPGFIAAVHDHAEIGFPLCAGEFDEVARQVADFNSFHAGAELIGVQRLQAHLSAQRFTLASRSPASRDKSMAVISACSLPSSTVKAALRIPPTFPAVQPLGVSELNSVLLVVGGAKGRFSPPPAKGGVIPPPGFVVPGSRRPSPHRRRATWSSRFPFPRLRQRWAAATTAPANGSHWRVTVPRGDVSAAVGSAMTVSSRGGFAESAMSVANRIPERGSCVQPAGRVHSGVPAGVK